jgi:type VI secretion system protein VasI
MRTHVVAALLLLSPAAALAQENELKAGVLRCATVDDSLSRLDCYDSLATRLSSPAEARSPGEWSVGVGKDPIDDTTTVVLGLPGAEYRAELLLRCKQKKPEVLLSLRGQIVGANEPVVLTRFGGAKADKKRWSVATDNKAVIFPGDTKVFVRQLLSVDRVVIQMDHFLRGPITDVFDVHRLKDFIGPFKQACSLE